MATPTSSPVPFRIGFGYDSHRVDPSRPLVLGGVPIPEAAGLAGHSDADVLIHAVIDALLGAAARGNIGEHFPDTDPRWKGADSAVLLEQVMTELTDAGWRVGNLDATVICERPRLKDHVAAIRRRLAALLHVTENEISVKGKTNEKMDDVGAGCGMIAHAAVLLVRS